MSKVLKVASEKMRDKIFQSLSEYMTTMTRELGKSPNRDAVVNLYVDQCRAVLGREIVLGAPTEKELALAEQLDAQFSTDEWLHQKGGLRQIGVKIHEDVRVLEVAHKAPGGLVRVTARVRDGRIDDVTLSGDFTMLPKFAPGALELALRGTALDTGAVRARVDEAYRLLGIQSPGLTVDDVTNAVMLLK
jgi:lipoate-protein ligase A